MRFSIAFVVAWEMTEVVRVVTLQTAMLTEGLRGLSDMAVHLRVRP